MRYRALLEGTNSRVTRLRDASSATARHGASGGRQHPRDNGFPVRGTSEMSVGHARWSVADGNGDVLDVLLEELQDALARGVGDAQRLDAELLLDLKRLQPGRLL